MRAASLSCLALRLVTSCRPGTSSVWWLGHMDMQPAVMPKGCRGMQRAMPDMWQRCSKARTCLARSLHSIAEHPVQGFLLQAHNPLTRLRSCFLACSVAVR